MIAKGFSRVKITGNIKLKTGTLVPADPIYYYDFQDPIIRNIYENISRSDLMDLASPVALEAGDTITFNMMITRSDFDYIWVSGPGFEVGLDSAYNIVETGCTITEINGRTDRTEQEAFLKNLGNTVTSYFTVSVTVNSSCSVDRFGGPQTSGVQSSPGPGGSIRTQGMIGVPIINIRIETAATGDYLWTVDSVGDGANQLETLQSGPDLIIANYNATLWNGVTNTGLVGIFLNNNQADNNGDTVITGGFQSSPNTVVASIIEPTGNSLQSTGNQDARLTIPINPSTGFTVAYDVSFGTLASRNGNIRSGGVSAQANSGPDNRFSLLADNFDGESPRIAFTLINPGSLYRGQQDYPDDILSEVRVADPVVLNTPYRIIAVARGAPLNTIELYVNDVLQGSAQYPAIFSTNNTVESWQLYIGGQFLDGVFSSSNTVLDEIRIYDRALSPVEIQALRRPV